MKRDISSPEPRSSWLAGIATLLSLVACYGTLAAISVLGALGIAMTLNTKVWAVSIVAFAVLAVVGLALGAMRHHKPWPLMVGVVGAAMIIFVMFAQYDRVNELTGFALLILAALWDFRIKKA